MNDVLLGASYRAFYDTIKPPEDFPLRLLTTANLRKYIPGFKAGAFCNLSALVYLNIGYKIGDSFDETVQLINNKMKMNAGLAI